MVYVWEKEKIMIKLKEREAKRDFLPLEIFDFPVEYISEDGRYYLLLLMDDEERNGEWWYVVETKPEVTLDYLEGKISVRDIFDRGKVFIGFRNYKDYDIIENLEPLERKIENGFIKEKDLPTYNAKMNLDEETLKEIKSLMRSTVSEELEVIGISEFPEVNIFSPEAEMSLAA